MLTVIMVGVPGLALGISRGRNRPQRRCSADSPLHSSISFLLFSAPPPTPPTSSVLATHFLSIPLLASSLASGNGKEAWPAAAFCLQWALRGGPGVVRWGRNLNRHLPEEAGRREHPCLVSVTRGTRMEGTVGAHQAPLPTQPGCGHSGPAGGNGGSAPTAVGWGWGRGG